MSTTIEPVDKVSIDHMLLVMMLMTDQQRSRPRDAAVYAVAMTADETPGITRQAVRSAGLDMGRNPIFRLMGSSQRPILVSDAETGHGYPGYAVWSDALRQLGAVNVQPVLLDHTVGLNTYSEMGALADHLDATGITSVILVDSAYHVLRTYLTLLEALRRVGLERVVRVYVDVVASDWDQEVAHSQGVLVHTRAGHVQDETSKVRHYIGQGHLASVEEALRYLRWRDGQTK